MSATFLILSQTQPKHNLSMIQAKAARYCPFEPIKIEQLELETTLTQINVWSSMLEASRGGWAAQHKDQALLYDGFIVEPQDASLERSVSSNLLHAILNQDAQSSLEKLCSLEGGYTFVHARPYQGQTLLEAATDFVGQRHLYYGHRDGLTAISNRALMVASALYGDAIPTPDPTFMAWFLSSMAAPFRDKTPWPLIQCVGPDHALRLYAGKLQILPRPKRAPMTRLDDFATHYEDLCAHVNQVTRHAGLPVRVALTGGKDSRAVLAGIIGARALDHIESAYLRAQPEHPDLIVGQRLAEHYGLSFVREQPHERLDHGTFLERMDQHLFLTEQQVHAWDQKGYLRLKPRLLLHGNLGELYRSHALPRQALGWSWLFKYYTSTGYLDRQDLLRDDVVAALKPQMYAWVESMHDNGVRPFQVHDLIHQYARMYRWVGQCNQADAALAPSVNPLSSSRLHRWYKQASLLDQRRHRAHFELIRRADDWLWRQPFAQSRWSKLMVPYQPAAMNPVQGQSFAKSPQQQDWHNNQALITSLLMDSGSDAFFDIVDRERLHARIKRMEQTPDAMNLKAIYGSLGVKLALSRQLHPRPITLEAHP